MLGPCRELEQATVARTYGMGSRRHCLNAKLNSPCLDDFPQHYTLEKLLDYLHYFLKAVYSRSINVPLLKDLDIA